MSNMNKFIRPVVLLFTLGLAGCHLAQSLTKNQVLIFITEADFGVAAGCYAEWLEPTVCEIGHQVLQDARIAAEEAVNGWQAAAKAVLVNEEENLSTDSKIRPYLDAVIALL
jgi:hypothetical protein